MADVFEVQALSPKKKEKKSGADQFNEIAGIAQTLYSIGSGLGEGKTNEQTPYMAGESNKKVDTLAAAKRKSYMGYT